MKRLAALILALVLTSCSSFEASTPPSIGTPLGPFDDPAEYRGLRWQGFGDAIKVEGTQLSWLHAGSSSSTRFYGHFEVSDGRREMLWLVKAAGPMPETGRLGGPDGPPWIVLDVAVLPSDVLLAGCGNTIAARHPDRPDIVAAWRFDESNGRIRTVDPRRVTCPREEERDRD